jgi:hypothetical protein
VSGLTVKRIAKAFLVSPAAMEKRITRTTRAIAEVGVDSDTPGASERRTRLAAVSTMIYLIFSEGYGSTPDTAAARDVLADDAIRLGQLLLSPLVVGSPSPRHDAVPHNGACAIRAHRDAALSKSPPRELQAARRARATRCDE